MTPTQAKKIENKLLHCECFMVVFGVMFGLLAYGNNTAACIIFGVGTVFMLFKIFLRLRVINILTQLEKVANTQAQQGDQPW